MDQNLNTVLVHDVHQNQITVPVEKLVWRVSVYGILKNNQDEILFQKNPQFNKLNLPGGSIEKGEDIISALKREFLEETGYSVSVQKLLGVDTDFFTYSDIYFHSIVIFYEVKLDSETVVAIDKTEGDSEAVIWVKKEDLNLDNVQPIYTKILKESLGL